MIALIGTTTIGIIVLFLWVLFVAAAWKKHQRGPQDHAHTVAAVLLTLVVGLMTGTGFITMVIYLWQTLNGH